MLRFCLLLAPLLCLGAVESYKEDFSAATEVPNNMMVLNGEFTVADDSGNKILSLAAEPLDTYSVLFGSSAKDSMIVKGRAKGESKGRRYPVFGYGLGGVTGTVLRISGAKKTLELVKNDEPLGSIEFPFPSDKWVWFQLQVRPDGGVWKAEGKAWVDGTEEPKNWMMSVSLDKEPVSGRASCWGLPYAGLPISFDDFSVEPIK
jgi:hypothetical protein